MDIVEKMASAGCFLGIAMSATNMIRPDDKFSSHIRFLFSVMFALVFLSPVINGEFGGILRESVYTNSQSTYTGIDDAIETEIYTYIRKNIEKSCYDILYGQGIILDEISVNINIEENNGIDITGIYLNTNQFDKAKEILQKEIGGDVLIYEKSETENTG